MAQFYTDPSRESDPHALPDAEAFYDAADGNGVGSDVDPLPGAGWYWWPCFPGCMPDGDPVGPFDTEEQAIKDAREGAE